MPSSDLQQLRTYVIYLRIIELLLGLSSIGLVVSYSNWYEKVLGNYGTAPLSDSRILSFLICTAIYLTPSLHLLIASVNKDSYEHLRKSTFELGYNIFASIIQCVSSIVLMAIVGGLDLPLYTTYFYAAGIMGLFNSFFYIASFYVSLKAHTA